MTEDVVNFEATICSFTFNIVIHEMTRKVQIKKIFRPSASAFFFNEVDQFTKSDYCSRRSLKPKLRPDIIKKVKFDNSTIIL